jgi:hypothetical protein
MVNMGTEGQIVDALYQSAFQCPPTAACSWGKLTLPFSKFSRTHEGFVRTCCNTITSSVRSRGSNTKPGAGGGTAAHDGHPQRCEPALLLNEL